MELKGLGPPQSWALRNRWVTASVFTLLSRYSVALKFASVIQKPPTSVCGAAGLSQLLFRGSCGATGLCGARTRGCWAGEGATQSAKVRAINLRTWDLADLLAVAMSACLRVAGPRTVRARPV